MLRHYLSTYTILIWLDSNVDAAVNVLLPRYSLKLGFDDFPLVN